MNRGEFLRRRRCRLLLLAAVLGIFLPVSQPSWITLAVGAGALAVIAFVYRRDCWGKDDTETAQEDTHA